MEKHDDINVAILHHVKKKDLRMNHKLLKPLVAVLLLSVASSAMALTKDITVTANIDASLDMTLDNNDALPSTVAMQYFPGTGLGAVTLQTKIWSNATDTGAGNVHIQLTTDPTLINTTGNGSTIPLSVTFGGKELATSDATGIATSVLFPNGADGVKTGSITQPLTISQKTPGVQETGSYSGVISLYLFQDAASAA